MMQVKHIIKTERLIIDELTFNDAPFIFELLNTTAWLKYIGDRGIETIENARSYILSGPLKSYQNNGFGLWLVRLNEGTPIGICGFIKREQLNDIDIGFAFLPAFEKKGYGSEAANAVLIYGKQKLNLTSVLAITNIDNINSIRLLEKCGFAFDRLVKLYEKENEVMLFSLHL